VLVARVEDAVQRIAAMQVAGIYGLREQRRQFGSSLTSLAGGPSA
jgi:hypothetical protein